MKIQRIDLISGSFILLIAYNLFNVANFLYQFIMARMLSPAEYSVLATLFVVVYFVSLFGDTIQTTVTTYIAGVTHPGKQREIIRRFTLSTIKYSLLLLFIYGLVVTIFASHVGIGRGLLLSAGILIPCTLLAAVMRGGLQGTKKFIALGGGLVGESLIKVCVATFFVAGGYAVGGAWAGVIIAGIISVPLAYFCLPFRKAPLRQVKIDSPFKKALVTLIVMCCVVGFYSFDLLIARMLFSEEVAGNYALAALLGKIILWGTMPIGRAYLPLATEANAQKKKTLLLKASIGSGILSLGILGAYSLFPEQIVTFFSGKQLVIAQELLFKTGLAMSILTFVNLYFMYFLAKLNEQEVTLKNKKISFMILAIVLGLTTECLLLFTARTPEIFSTNLVISALAVSIYTLTAHQFAK